jgi:hypothetical protein
MNLIRFGFMISIWFCYVFDMIWVMVLEYLECFGCDVILIWFGYGLYGFDMVWERSAFFRVPDGLASRKETETALGQPFGRFLEGFCAFDMI